jgi:hypothetical protein
VSAVPGKAVLDARADRVLADLAGARGQVEQGGEYGAAVLSLAGDLAGVLRVQFPGRDAVNARVLATVLSELAGLGRELGESETVPDEAVPVLLDVLCLAADDLNQGDGPNRKRAPR